MAALVDRDDAPAGIGEPMRGLRPSMPRLPAAVQQERRARAMPDLVRDEPIAGGAGEELAHAPASPRGMRSVKRVRSGEDATVSVPPWARAISEAI